MQAHLLQSITRASVSLAVASGGVAVLALPACVSSPDSPDPQPETLRYASSDATRLEAGIFEWHLTPVGDDLRVLGLNRDGGVDVEMILRHDDETVEIEMVHPDPGVARIDPATETLVGTLPNAELLGALGADLEGFADEGLVPRSHNSWGCWTASGAAAVACGSAVAAPSPPTIAACAAATAVAAAACSEPHCDQIQCNAMCTSGGHMYGWCASEDPWSCGCHGHYGGHGNDGGEGGGGDGSGPSGGCSDDWDCPGWGYCISGICS
jgi:hypothetical protein